MSTDTSTDLVAALDATDPALHDADHTDGQDHAGADNDADETVEGEDELGDKGKQALERMKTKLQAERAARRAAEAKLNESTPADDADRIQREADARATEKANGRIVRAELRAAAAGKLSDPADALTFIDPTQFDVDDDGEVDQEEIAQAVADLLAKKPYLAAQGGPKPPKPDPSQGAAGRGTATTADRFAQAIDGLI